MNLQPQPPTPKRLPLVTFKAPAPKRFCPNPTEIPPKLPEVSQAPTTPGFSSPGKALGKQVLEASSLSDQAEQPKGEPRYGHITASVVKKAPKTPHLTALNIDTIKHHVVESGTQRGTYVLRVCSVNNFF